MTIQSHNGKIWYKQSDYLVKFFENTVSNSFDEQNTEFWETLVLKSYQNRNFATIRDIVGRGQANFDEPFNGLTPNERVLVYCYDNMQQHVVSKLYILKKHKNLFNKYLFSLNKNVIFIDFGCGPLSSGIALTRYYSESQESQGESIKFHYIGIDKSEAMLRKAREFSLYPGLFHSSSTFDFFNPRDPRLQPFYQTLVSCIDKYNYQDNLIILNFSYFFASPSLDASKLVNFIQSLLEKYQSSEVCLMFQNAQGSRFNEKWHLFKNQVTELKTAISGEISEAIYYHESLGVSPEERLTRRFNERATKLYYDIQFRNTGA